MTEQLPSDPDGPRPELEALFFRYLSLCDLEGPEAAERFLAALPAHLQQDLDERLEILRQQNLIDAPVDDFVGPYRLERPLGQGGMGRVYLASQREPVARLVALKLIHPWLADKLRYRFVIERHIVAALDHDGIARLYEAGLTDAHQLWFAMEYVDGPPIDAFCRQHRLDLAARLRLVVQLCRAVEHAHQRGVIHRDLTSRNVLVAGTAAAPRPKIIDFGLARLDRRDGPPGTALTSPGGFVGTLGYASPEQVAGAADVDTRTDVHGLGAILFELLTGDVPIRVPAGVDPVSFVRAHDAPLPSASVARAGSATDEFARTTGRADHRQLAAALRGDLDAVVRCALEKDRDRRYATVGALAADLEACIQHRPVTARRQTRSYVLARFARRHRVAIATVALVLITVIASGANATIANAHAQRRLSDFKLFGIVRHLRTLDEKEIEEPLPASADSEKGLTAWIAEVQAVLDLRPEIEARRAQMDADAPDSTTAAAVGPQGLDDENGARRELRKNIDEMLLRCDAMRGSEGTLTLAKTRLTWIQETLPRTRADERWAVAASELAADERFRGIALQPQPGLVPLGADPETHLQVFAWLLPGAEEPRRENDRLVLTPSTCPVFVLVPGGNRNVGSQSEDKGQPNYDPDRETLERDHHIVDIPPYLLSKYELTHSQLKMLTRRPFADDPDDAMLPAHDIDAGTLTWIEDAWNVRKPTEDEWESAARCGTTTRWWRGPYVESLQGYVNVADQSLRAIGSPEDTAAVPWNDGFPGPAPVDSFKPNDWGFYHMIGNVAELCLATSPEGELSTRICGGTFQLGWLRCRTTWSVNWRGQGLASIGFRPALSLKL